MLCKLCNIPNPFLQGDVPKGIHKQPNVYSVMCPHKKDVKCSKLLVWIGEGPHYEYIMDAEEYGVAMKTLVSLCAKHHAEHGDHLLAHMGKEAVLQMFLSFRTYKRENLADAIAKVEANLAKVAAEMARQRALRSFYDHQTLVVKMTLWCVLRVVV